VVGVCLSVCLCVCLSAIISSEGKGPTFKPGIRPDPVGGAYSAPLGPIAGFKGPTSKGRGEEGRKGRAREGEKGREGTYF